MGSSLDHVRASRYRRLALIEKDRATADLLNQLAREAELGILFTPDRRSRPSSPGGTQSNGYPRSASSSSGLRERILSW